MSVSPLRPATTRYSNFGARPTNVNRNGASSTSSTYSWLSLGKPEVYLKESFIPNPNGFRFPQDQPRVQRMADLLACFGHDRLKGVSVRFILYAISRVRMREAVQAFEHLTQDQIIATRVALLEGGDDIN